MKKIDILIFVIILLIIIGIFSFAIWNANNDLNEFNSVNQIRNVETNNEQTNIVTEKETNTEEATLNNNNNNNIDYVGKWYISEDAYLESEKVEEIIEKKEDNEISDSEYEAQMKSYINRNIVELDINKYVQNTLRFNFTLTNYAGESKEAKLENIEVNLNGNIGTFTYTDNLGTSGNGTITLIGNQIELRLETTKAEQGVSWGLEGIYTFSYRK